MSAAGLWLPNDLAELSGRTEARGYADAFVFEDSRTVKPRGADGTTSLIL